jgi:D-alanyl-D-alanine carboxypeptidase
MSELAYRQRILAALQALGIDPELVAAKGLVLHREADQLVVAQTNANGRQFHLTEPAAQAWWRMQAAAADDRVAMELVSAFRGVERQCEIIAAKLARGMRPEIIFTLSAPPGYSEHHSGRAIDINTPGCRETEEEFELTEAFRWLNVNAAGFGYALSYPRGNTLGFIYEPWHWCFCAPKAGQR